MIACMLITVAATRTTADNVSPISIAEMIAPVAFTI